MSLRAFLLVLACLSASLSAAAQTEDDVSTEDEADQAGEPPENVGEARKHFKRGVELYADGDVGGSLVEFEQAYRLQPSFRLLYNLAQVSAELLDYVKAERYFVRYLEEGGDEIDPERRIEVEAELERLRTRIGTVTVETNQEGAEIFVDDVPVGRAPLQALPVSAGQRRVRVEKAGFETETRVVNIIGGQPQSVRIELESAAAAQTTYSFGDDAPPNHPAIWMTVGTGVLALATAGAAFWTYRGERNYDDELMRSTTRSTLDDLADKTEQRALITDILLGATVVSAIVTTVLWVNGTSSESDEDVARRDDSLQFGPGSLRATF